MMSFKYGAGGPQSWSLPRWPGEFSWPTVGKTGRVASKRNPDTQARARNPLLIGAELLSEWPDYPQMMFL